MESTTILLILMWLGIRLGLGLFFKKAEIEFWKAFIPIYSTLIWLKLIKKPKWWLFLTFIPVVNIVLGIGMIVELMNSFGRRNVVEHVLASVLGYIFLPYIALTKELNYTGPIDYTDKKKSRIREWSEAIFFAVIAASIIRTFTIEAFQIPTSSMEGTLLRGDFLFVSKLHYGAKTPKTPLALPFMHHSIPVLGIPAYLNWIKLPYLRFPAFQSIKNNDIVVFNYPIEDYRPSDKREHYIKRCVGIPGDNLKVYNGQLIINEDSVPLSKSGQMSYNFNVSRESEFRKWVHSMNLNEAECQCNTGATNYLPYKCIIYGNSEVRKELQKQKWITSPIFPGQTNPFDRNYAGQSNAYPADFRKSTNLSKHWTRDFYGPIHIPKKGEKIELTKNNFLLYRRVFNYYEEQAVISLERMIQGYATLKKIESMILTNSNIGQAIDIATTIKNSHSITKVSNELSKWSDQYYISGYIESNVKGLKNSKKEAFIKNYSKDFVKLFRKYQKNQLNEELKLITAEIKSYNKSWIESSSINVKKALLEIKSKDIYPCLVNGELSSSYTFEQDYFFMMGDNRHNSGDSRAWGFVPQDHIVGKAVFIWLSTDPDEGSFIKGIRWNRLCSFVSAEGISNSFLWEFLIGGTILYFTNKWWKKKKKKKISEAE
jgi:signal peptidase I